MRVVQIVLADASEYEKKSQRIDFQSLSGEHQVTVLEADREEKFRLAAADAHLAHVYGKALPRRYFRGFPVPYLAPAAPEKGLFSFRRVSPPAAIVSPLENLPEAVEENYFRIQSEGARALALSEGVAIKVRRIGTYGAHRPGVTSLIERTLARLHRFRDDVTWSLMDHPPTPADLAGVDLWVDPAQSAEDFDGFVAEAVVVGTPVVAVRTAINLQRLEKGRTGFLVPPNDPNEMTHAILTALFKPEVAEQKDSAARQTVSKYRPRRRLRVLLELYGNLTA